MASSEIDGSVSGALALPRIFRFWVELRDRRDGSVRELPLQAVRCIHLPARKGEARRPDEEILRLEDGSQVIEARDLEGLKARLREKYPEETHERLLHWLRDLEAERHKREAMESLIELLVAAAVRDVLSEPSDSHTKD